MRRLVCTLGVFVWFLSGAGGPAAADTVPLVITIINTADEHGWLQPYTPFGSNETLGGAANIYAWWVAYEAYEPHTMLLLSSGDNWTGPSISTWFQGAPMIEAFNLMGYDVAAIGNHEFDFGRDVMAQRFSEAEYPYLSANIRDAASGQPAEFARPYTLLEVNGVLVGVIGLTTTATPTTTHPGNIGDLVFTDYVEALETFVPQMRAEGAQIIVVLAHVCLGELIAAARQTGDLVDAMFAGHCNERIATQVNGVSVMGAGDAWRSYARLTLLYEPSEESASGDVQILDQAVVDVAYDTAGGSPVEADPTLLALVERWQAEADAQLAVTIGYSERGIQQRSWAMGNLVTDAWLWAYPAADIAMTNWGGFRQPVEPGVITWGDVVGVLPFENTLVAVEITGVQLIENLACCGGALGGITAVRSGQDWQVTFLDGRPFDLQAAYTVLVNDFMYAGGDGYLFGAQDTDAYFTGIHWRQPVLDYIASLNTSETSPLDAHLDTAPRGDT